MDTDAVYLVRDLAFPSVDNALVYKYTNKDASQTCIAENSHSANIQQNLETPASNSGHSLDSNSKDFGEGEPVESTEYKMNNIAILLANNAQADDVQGELFTTNIEEGAGDQRLVSNYKMMNTHQKETVAKAERERLRMRDRERGRGKERRERAREKDVIERERELRDERESVCVCQNQR